jgi:hypothetical protein
MSRRRTSRPHRWLAGLVAMVPVGTLLAMIVVVSPASADVYGGYSISSGEAGSYCLDDWLDNLEPGGSALVDAYQCNGTAAQSFKWGNGNNTILLQSPLIFPDAPLLCLDVAGGGTADGTPVRMYQCNGTPAQTWVPLTSQTGGPAMLENPQSGKCLNIPGFQVTPPGGPPNQLIIWDCNGLVNELWSSPGW